MIKMQNLNSIRGKKITLINLEGRHGYPASYEDKLAKIEASENVFNTLKILLIFISVYSMAYFFISYFITKQLKSPINEIDIENQMSSNIKEYDSEELNGEINLVNPAM